MIEGCPRRRCAALAVPVVPADAVHARHRPRAGRRRDRDHEEGLGRPSPTRDRPKLLEAAAAVEKRLRADVPKQDPVGGRDMTQARRLTVTKADGAEWRAAGGRAGQDDARRDGARRTSSISPLKERERVQADSNAVRRRSVKRALRAASRTPSPSLALLAMVVLPLLEICRRGVCSASASPASGPIVQHLTLWVGFLGAAIAAREGQAARARHRHVHPARTPAPRRGRSFAAAVAACASLILAWGGVQLVLAEREARTTIGADIPTWVAQVVLPVAFALIARSAWSGGRSAAWTGRGIGLARHCAAGSIAPLRDAGAGSRARPAWPGLAIVACGRARHADVRDSRRRGGVAVHDATA